MSDVVRTPWNDSQITALNLYQAAGFMHPYTCGTKEKHAAGAGENLLATPSGWVCPNCDYRQYWAHAFSADLATVVAAKRDMDELLGGVS